MNQKLRLFVKGESNVARADLRGTTVKFIRPINEGHRHEEDRDYAVSGKDLIGSGAAVENPLRLREASACWLRIMMASAQTTQQHHNRDDDT